MKFQVERDVLADAVGWAARALPARPNVPVLAGMLLAAGDGLTLSTFDYETSAKSAVAADVDDPGTVLVSGRLLAEITKLLPSRPVNVAMDDGGQVVTVKCGAAKFTLRTMPQDEYPSLPEMPPLTGTAGADVLAEAIAQVAVAAGRDDTLPALTGVLVEFGDGTVTLVATDRYRLAIRELDWTAAEDGFRGSVLVPAAPLTAAAKTGGGAAQTALSLAGGAADGGSGILGWSAGGRETTMRLLGDLSFPKYAALLPSEFSAVAELETGPFAEAVKRVALVAERNTPVRLKFSAKDGLTLEAGAGDEATASEEVPAEFDGDGDLNVCFNPAYLLDGLGAIGSDVATISFTTPAKPAVLTGKTEDGPPDYRYVIMPIRSAG